MNAGPFVIYHGRELCPPDVQVPQLELDGSLCSVTDLLEGGRHFVASVPPQPLQVLASLNWMERLQLLGAHPHDEAIVPLPLMPAELLLECIRPQASPEFIRAVFLLLCRDRTEEQIEARQYHVPHVHHQPIQLAMCWQNHQTPSPRHDAGFTTTITRNPI
jgi:hypothetical protein